MLAKTDNLCGHLLGGQKCESFISMLKNHYRMEKWIIYKNLNTEGIILFKIKKFFPIFFLDTNIILYSFKNKNSYFTHVYVWYYKSVIITIIICYTIVKILADIY